MPRNRNGCFGIFLKLIGLQHNQQDTHRNSFSDTNRLVTETYSSQSTELLIPNNAVVDCDSLIARRKQEGHIRLFVSSTFSDMDDERNILTKVVFPRVRKKCQELGIDFRGIDLRWGINPEQINDNLLLPLLFNAIDDCRPYFIGLIGNRYGAIAQIPEEFPSQFPGLDISGAPSATELEIRYGVFNHPSMEPYAIFLLRDQNYDNDHANSRANQQEVNRLRSRIRQSNATVLDYDNLKDFETSAESAIWNIIDRDFDTEELDDNQRVFLRHQGYAHRHTRGYVEIHEAVDRLDDYIRSTRSKPLVIVGEPGTGKSALLANWHLKRGSQNHRHAIDLAFFVGADNDSTNWKKLVYSIMSALKTHFGLKQPVPQWPSEPEKLHKAFIEMLSLASNRGRVNLIIDDVSNLEKQDGSHGLVWLPEQIPFNVRMILSCVPGRVSREAESREWDVFEMPRISNAIQSKIVTKYFDAYNKTVPHDLVGHLNASPLLFNPFLLRMALNEIRLINPYWRNEDELEIPGESVNERAHRVFFEHLNKFTQCTNPEQLIRTVIGEWRNFYNTSQPLSGTFVEDVLMLLISTRFGLNEKEIAKLLLDGDEEFPELYLGALLSHAEGGFIIRDRDQRYNFANKIMYSTVKALYETHEHLGLLQARLDAYFDKCMQTEFDGLATTKVHKDAAFDKSKEPHEWDKILGKDLRTRFSSEQTEGINRLMDHLLADAILNYNTDSVRHYAQERIHLLTETQNWDKLYHLLTSTLLLDCALRADITNDLEWAWKTLEANSDYKTQNGLEMLLTEPELSDEAAACVVMLAYKAGMNETSSQATAILSEREAFSPQQINFIDAMMSLASDPDQADTALAQFEQEQFEKTNEDKPDPKKLLPVYMAKAILLRQQGKTLEAIEVGQKAIELAEQADPHTLVVNLHPQSMRYMEIGEPQIALEIFVRAERLIRQYGYDNDLPSNLEAQKFVLYEMVSQYSDAEDWIALCDAHHQLARVFRDLDSPNETVSAMLSSVSALEKLGDMQQAQTKANEILELVDTLDLPEEMLFVINLKLEDFQNHNC